MAVALTREQRDALRADLLLELSALACDISLMLKKDRPSDAEGFCRRLVDDARLLDDLGWEEADPTGELFAHDAARAARAVVASLRGVRRSRTSIISVRSSAGRVIRCRRRRTTPSSKAAIRRDMDQNLDVRSACTAALEALGAEGGG